MKQIVAEEVFNLALNSVKPLIMQLYLGLVLMKFTSFQPNKTPTREIVPLNSHSE